MSFFKNKEVILSLFIPIILAVLGFYSGIIITKSPNIMIHSKNLNKIELVNNGEGTSEVINSLFYYGSKVFCMNGTTVDEVAGIDYLKYDAKSKAEYSLIPSKGIVEIASCKRCKEDDINNILSKIDIFIEYKGKGFFNKRKYFCSNEKTCNLDKLLDFSESC